MKEVSCRVLELNFAALDEKQLPVQRLVEGVGYSLAHLRNRHERIDWDAYRRIMQNVESIWTREEIIELGGRWVDAPIFRWVQLITGTLFTPRQFYKWLAGVEQAGVGTQMFSCMSTVFRELAPDHVVLEVRLAEGYEPCSTFYLLTLGGFRAVPRVLGLPEATVRMTPIRRGMEYDVRLPHRQARSESLRQTFRWLTSRSAVVQELDDAHATLKTRYDELESAREKVALQAAQLRTANTINLLVQRDIDLEPMLEAITHALVTEGHFKSARVDVNTVVDGLLVVRNAAFGSGGSAEIVQLLEGRGGFLRGILTATTEDSLVTRGKELLSFVVPSISMALDDALSYMVVQQYRHDLELRVEQRTAELVAARDELTQTIEDLEAAREARDRIFANVNHDVRSPLTLILLTVAEARRTVDLDDGFKKTLDAIEHGARRVLRMVDELLILAEGREGGRVRIWAGHCHLSEMTETVANAWQSAARAAGLTLVKDVDPDVTVRADPNAIERILANLISNAIKFTPKGGVVWVRIRTRAASAAEAAAPITVKGAAVSSRPPSGFAILEIQDNGPGIDDDLKSRLFRRFERGKRAPGTAISGSGIGLSLVKELAEAHGGSASVRDAEGGGAIFTVELPISGPRASIAPPSRSPDSVTRGPNPIPPPPASDPSLHAPGQAELRPTDFGVAQDEADLPTFYEPDCTPRGTILLAEDDPNLRDRTARLLAQDYRVIAAPDGVAALELARQHSPDLLLTDVAMPGMDGIELTRQFRAIPTNRLAPVLVITTFGGVRDKLSGFDAGAVDYIHKPFEPDELRARVKSQLMLRSLALQLLETEKLAALGTLSAGLAHEIRNPANGIINAVGPLKELLPPEAISPGSPAGQLLDIVEHCSQQVAAMSRQLLGFKRNVEPKRQAVPIDALVSRVIRTAKPSLEGVELREQLEYQGPVHCAEPLIAQVLTNLVQNGAHAAGRGGWVEVRTGIEDSRVVIEVRDSGPGVPEELRERIFEPFFTTKPAGSGTGLGLSTARDIILRHGGTLDVRSSAGRSVFRVEIPVPA